MTAMTAQIPQSDRRIEDVQGHWLLARLGKRVLRPGGLELTTRMLARLPLPVRTSSNSPRESDGPPP